MHYLLEKKSNNFSNVVSKSKEIVFYDFGFAVKKARGFLLKKTREIFYHVEETRGLSETESNLKFGTNTLKALAIYLVSSK